MGKLRAVWRFQSRSVLGSNVIRARLSTLFPVANATRWNSMYDAVKYVVNKFGLPRYPGEATTPYPKIAELNNCLKNLDLVMEVPEVGNPEQNMKVPVQFTRDDMKFLKEYITVSSSFSFPVFGILKLSVDWWIDHFAIFGKGERHGCIDC
jgi:hypothetical protein